MKTSLNLSIAKPCSENWNTFTPSEKGRFCGSCSKVVLDFTTAGDEEILNFLQNKPTHVCGRFKGNQLKTYATIEPLKVTTGLALLKAGVLSLLLMLIGKPGVAQKTPTPIFYTTIAHSSEKKFDTAVDSDYTVKGVVTSEEDGSPIPGVSILLKGTAIGIQTDKKGYFEFPEKLQNGDVLYFSFIGYESKEVVISKQTYLDIKLEEDHSFLGEIAITEPYTSKQPFFKRTWEKVKNIF
jgi:hypothetical protein